MNEDDFIDAIENNNFQQLQDLIDQGMDIDFGLQIAAEFDNIRTIEFLLNHAQPSLLGKNIALSEAAANGNYRMVELLLDNGANPNGNNGNPLIRAAGHAGDINIVRLLLDRGANIHIGSDAALDLAIANDITMVIEYLLARGANFNVLSPEDQVKYRNLIPRVISHGEYFH